MNEATLILPTNDYTSMEYKKTILLGRSDESAYTLTLEATDDTFDVSYEEFKNIFDDDEGEEKAREYLEGDTELWKMAVASDSTMQGFEDWCEDVLKYDGWEHVLGEDSFEDLGGGWYAEGTDSGVELPFDDYDLFDFCKLDEEDFNSIVDGIVNSDKEKLIKVFEQYEKYTPYQLSEL